MLNNLNIRTLDWPWLTFRVSVRSVYGQIDFNSSPIYIDFPEKKEISLQKATIREPKSCEVAIF